MTISYTETETKEGEDTVTEKVMSFHVDIEENTFLDKGVWKQDNFNVFIHDSLQHLKGEGGVPISTLKSIRDKKL